jgi:hypothetical protein
LLSAIRPARVCNWHDDKTTIVRYIRTGNYARILNQMSMGEGTPDNVNMRKIQKLKDLGLLEGGERRAQY